MFRRFCIGGVAAPARAQARRTTDAAAGDDAADVILRAGAAADDDDDTGQNSDQRSRNHQKKVSPSLHRSSIVDAAIRDRSRMCPQHCFSETS